MTERANFAIRIINQATGPARQIAQSINAVKKSLATVSTKPIRGIETALENATGRFDDFVNRTGKLKGFRDRLRNVALSAKQGESHIRTLSRAIGGELSRAASLAKDKLVAMGSNVPWGTIGNGIDKMTMKLTNAAKSAAKLGLAVGAVAAYMVTKGVVAAAKFSEQSRLALTNLTGSAKEGAAAFGLAIQLAKDYGLPVMETTKQLIKLRAAQFSIGEGIELIKLTTDLRAIGATAEETQSAIRAITQIKAKGRLQSEELVGQLAEAGIATTLVYEALGKTLGKTQDEVRSLITAGKVSAEVGIKAIQEAILKKAHITKAGQAGKQFADATLSGMLDKLKAAPGLLYLKAAESAKAVTPSLKRIVDSIMGQIESIRPEAIGKFVENILGAVEAAIPLVTEFAKGFGEGFSEITAALKSGNVTEALKKDFRDLGRGFARFLDLAVSGMKLIGKAIAFAVSPTGKLVGQVLLGALMFFKMAQGIGAVGIAFGAADEGRGALMVGLGAMKKSLGWIINGGLAGGIRLAGRALAALATGGIAMATSAASGLAMGFKAVWTAIMGPVGLVVAAAAAGYAFGTWLNHLTGISDKLGEIMGKSKGFNGVVESIGKTLGLDSWVAAAKGNQEANNRVVSSTRGLGDQLAANSAPKPVTTAQSSVADMNSPAARAQMAMASAKQRSSITTGPITIEINAGTNASPQDIGDATRAGLEKFFSDQRAMAGA